MAAATIVTSVLTGTANSYATAAYQFNAVATDFVSSGVVGTITNTTGVSPATGAFAVNQDASPDMGVTITAGRAWIQATPSGQTSQGLSIYMSANYTSYTISANASGSTKYDWIYLKVDPTNSDAPDSTGDNATSVYTSRSSSNSTDNGTPPTYGILLAIVTVANGASSISNASIVDGRPVAVLTATSQGWTPVTDSWTYSSGAGTNTAVLTVPTDATTKYSAGMRVKFSNNSAVNYGIITKVTSTTLTIYLGTDYAIANSAISSIYYSDRKSPFGFNLDPAKWTVSVSNSTSRTTSSTTYASLTDALTGPIGSWKLSWSTPELLFTVGNAAGRIGKVTLSSDGSTETNPNLTRTISFGTVSTSVSSPAYAEETVTLATATTFTLLGLVGNAAHTIGLTQNSSVGSKQIRFVCAYL